MGGRGNFMVQSDGSWSSMGGYMNAKIQKLDHQFVEKSESVQKLSNLFDGVAIHVNGYTIPTQDELKMIMAQHGGKFHAYYSSSSTTHVIASNLARAKTKEIRPNQTIVRPEWIVDSLQEGKLQPVQPYIVAVHGGSRSQATLQGFVDKNKNESGHGEAASTKLVCESPSPSNQTAKVSRSIVPTADSSFLSDFYSHSRLHFLSTWKAELADFVRSLTASDTFKLSGRLQLMECASSFENCSNAPSNGKSIIHLDMDCFFVSVGLLSRPQLRDRPIAVTHHSPNTPSTNKQRAGTDPEYEKRFYKRKSGKNDNNSLDEAKAVSTCTVPSYSEIASCSYEARKAGLKNGMFYGKAKELCPDLIAIPYDFDTYRATSQKLYEILTSYTPNIEAVSCDEALLDVTSLVSDTGLSPSHIANHIRAKVKEATGCNASAGIGPNIALARMATRVGKPDGQHEVTLEQAQSFICDHPVKDLPGVGYSTASRLGELGVSTCGDLQIISIEDLKKEFGVKTGEKLFNLSRGVDNREVRQSKERKSVSADVNYGIRLSSMDELEVFLANLAKEVSSRLKKAGVVGRKVTLKLMVRLPDAPAETAKFGGHGICQSTSRSKNMDGHNDDCNVILKETVSLFKSNQVPIPDLRGIGIQITQLEPASARQANAKSSIIRFVKPKSNIINESQNQDESSHVQGDAASLVDARPESIEQLPGDLDEISSGQSSNESGISRSFLEALPHDLRAEVERDLQAHQAALQSGKLSATSNAISPSKLNQRKKPLRKVKFGKSPSKRKCAGRNPKSCNTSPNKLITDLFPVRIGSGKSVADDSAERKPPRRMLLEEEYHTSSSSSGADNPPRAPSPPSLGGARTIPESRDAVRQWSRSFAATPPVESDVHDVMRYLAWLVTESRDMSGACLVLHTLRRSIMTLIEHCDIMDTQCQHDSEVTSWIDVYNRIATSLCDVVKKNYDGAVLSVKFIT